MTLSNTVLTSSVYIETSVSYGRRYEKNRLSSNLLGQSRVNPVGGLPASSVVDAGLTGTHESPSWTHKSVGFNQAFVGMSLSSSHNSERLANYFVSGTEPVESSPVPASATLYYSKNTGYQRIIVKHTASALDVVNAVGTTSVTGVFLPYIFIAGKGVDVSMVTGNLDFGPSTGTFGGRYQSTPTTAAEIYIPVTSFGKIVDIKVWVELVHVSSSGNGGGAYPLGSTVIALRSPNVTWGNAHPIRNDKNLKMVYTTNTDFGGDFPNGTYSLQTYKSLVGNQPDQYFGPKISSMFKDTFILWEGPGYFQKFSGPWDVEYANGLDGTDTGTTGLFVTNHYPCFQRDRSMRVVFADSAQVTNPRHHTPVSTSGNFSGAPNAGIYKVEVASAFGFDCPWTSETEISGANTFAAAGSPPTGWLTGPGGTNGVNEWPTTGSNYGASSIRPLYPMLDPIFQKKRFGSEALRLSGQVLTDPVNRINTVVNSNQDSWTGFRPGLRGTEINGTWTLLISLSGWSGANPPPMYFRQVRLEFIVRNSSFSGQSSRRSSRKLSPTRATPHLFSSMSGSDAFDITQSKFQGSLDAFISDTFILADGHTEIGSTFGVVLNTGSINTNDHALTYSLTGALADISGSAPGWLLNNQFGMPSIPQSSSSLVPYVSILLTDQGLASDIITPHKTLDGPRRLSDVASDVNPALPLWQLAETFSSGTAT